MYALQTRELLVSRHVVTIFPSHTTSPPPSATDSMFTLPLPVFDTGSDLSSLPNNSVESNNLTPNSASVLPETAPAELNPAPINSGPTRISTRIKNPPPYLKDYQCNIILHTLSTAHSSSRTSCPLFHLL